MDKGEKTTETTRMAGVSDRVDYMVSWKEEGLIAHRDKVFTCDGSDHQIYFQTKQEAVDWALRLYRLGLAPVETKLTSYLRYNLYEDGEGGYLELHDCENCIEEFPLKKLSNRGFWPG